MLDIFITNTRDATFAFLLRVKIILFMFFPIVGGFED